MSIPFSLARLSSLAAAALLAACGTLPAEPPTVPAPALALPAAFTQAQGLPGAQASGALGWQALGDPMLGSLIERGLAANLDLQQAAERVQRSRALAAGSRAALWPSGGVGVGASAREAAEAEAPGAGRAARRSDSVQASATLSWELDLFGRLRRQAGAAEARVAASAADAEALRLSVAAEIAQAWFALAGARERTALADEAIANRRATLDLVQRRAAAGYRAPIDEARARADLAAAEAEHPLHEAAATVATHRIAVLLGALPSGFELPVATPPAPQQVLLHLPEPRQWLATRPDLRAAEASLQALALDAAAVRAEFLPRLSVGGMLGFVAGSVSGLGAAGAASWFVGPSLTLPVFDQARIEARLAAAQAQQREALLAYRQRVLLATEEVENALARVRQGQRLLAALQQRTQHARNAEALARKRYEAGASDLLELLDAQRSAQQAALALSSELTAQRQQIVALQRALGTGVQRADAPAASTAVPLVASSAALQLPTAGGL